MRKRDCKFKKERDREMATKKGEQIEECDEKHPLGGKGRGKGYVNIFHTK